MTQKLSELSEKLAKDTESLGETADSFKRALVENQRSISLAISDDAKAREEFLTKFAARRRPVLRRLPVRSFLLQLAAPSWAPQ
ncbi:hypothetical protein [Raoultella planticola]|uniref:Uncharacterized protein n=1 Tax=Raoultella planticola TaxID=575 RepID=A0A9Q9P1X1_RAOPL|nr:hypothetical protein [Raoultella planticola]UYA92978.1 hypothetical protein KKU17_p00480 [Raoultella planticola]